MNPPITQASVKVMRSHDYCHFEICLSTGVQEQYPSAQITTTDIDELRKTAARLADKAVEQYKIAKQNAQILLEQSYGFARLKSMADEARKTPEPERTSEQKAEIKALEDFVHYQKYDYQDQWDDED